MSAKAIFPPTSVIIGWVCGSQTAITNSENESLFAIDYVPDSKNILYSADKGGNEIDHIYLLKPDGIAKDLTPGENEKANFAGWSGDRLHMYYLSNKRNPQFFDLYRMKVGDWEPELLYENNEAYSVSGISDSGKLTNKDEIIENIISAFMDEGARDIIDSNRKALDNA